MLVKSFTDDLAWDVQRQLVNGYFRPPGLSVMPAVEYPLPAPMMSAIVQTVSAMQKAFMEEMTRMFLAQQETALIHGITAGQVWRMFGLQPSRICFACAAQSAG